MKGEIGLGIDMLIGLVSAGAINYYSAIPILLGNNIGTTGGY
ncbi:MAG: hypothetical protein ACOCUX_03340 [Halanaerobium sp.]